MELCQAVNPRDGSAIDHLLAVFFPGPHSYTGEDSLELFPHGNPLLLRRLVQAIRSLDGVRLAEPGEFTRRAFLNGKLDLLQAEAVGELLHATAENALHNARRQLEGALSRQIKALAQSVRDLSVRLELSVDFAEEEHTPDLSEWLPRLHSIAAQLHTLRDSFRSRPAHHVPRVVFYGAPNAGKSSLVNALLAEDRLLVSDIPGTTRDYVEAHLLLPSGEVRLVDTAGLAAQAVDQLDALSMQKSLQVRDQADWAVLVLDRSSSLPPEAAHWIHEAKTQGHGILFSKSDLSPHSSTLSTMAALECQPTEISAGSGQSIEALKTLMDHHVFGKIPPDAETWLASERQLECVQLALQGIDRALGHFQGNFAPVELLAFEMQTVRDALASLIGEISSEDVLQAIFAGFCIGK